MPKRRLKQDLDRTWHVSALPIGHEGTSGKGLVKFPGGYNQASVRIEVPSRSIIIKHRSSAADASMTYQMRDFTQPGLKEAKAAGVLGDTLSTP